MFQSKRKLHLLLIAVFCICLVLGMFASCTGDTPDNPDDSKPPVDSVDYGIDNVYYTTDGDKEYTFSIVKNTFTITGLNGEQKGTFTYKDGTLTLSFSGSDTTTASATIENGVLKLTYNGSSYRMLLRKQFTVTFNTAGGSAVEKQQVMNGGHAVKPQDPTRNGYIFVGWYADEDYKSPFSFDTAIITSDTTVYGRFVKQSEGRTEYTVSLVCEGTVYDPVTTVNGVLYNLPTPKKDGAEFAGWWMSDYQSASKLTCQYTDQQLTQDITLYAVFKTPGTPLVSVGEKKITWQSLGATLSYRVTIMKGDTTIAKSNVGTNEFAFDFSAQEAGEYTVTVECNGKSSTAYVKNKVLDRVSNFRVVNGVLLFDPVAHAEKYIITVICGTPGHSHKNIDNGSSTNYMFSFCDMPKDGISFAVTAKAEGYLDSTQTFVFFLGFGAVDDVKLENGKLVWNAVENAGKYLVEISADGINYTSTYVTEASFDATGLDAGKLYVKVTPVAEGYYSEPATAKQLEKKTLALPSGVNLTGNTLSWNAVRGANSYLVEIEGKTYPATTNSLVLTSEMLGSGKTEFSVRVMAVGATEAENSPYTTVTKLKYGTMGKVSYAGGAVTWDPVLGAAKYFVTVGGKTYEVDGDKNSFVVTFESAGNIEISVCFADASGSKSVSAATTVKVFAIEFDSKGGSEVKTIYKAKGDPLSLTESKRDGYEFVGWFTTPGGLAEGKPFSDTTYNKDEGTVLYADWTAKTYKAILVPGDDAKLDVASAGAVYGKKNDLPVPTPSDTSKLFVGWYTDVNGAGIRYTNENGEALREWITAGDLKLYAYFIDSLKFILIDNGKSYSVQKGDLGIGNITRLEIPATHNGLPVTAIEAGAFADCTSLVEIIIPNTVQRIDVGIDGFNGSGSAFEKCSKLTAIHIDDVPGTLNARYKSHDGVLYGYNDITGKWELLCIPGAKEGPLNVLVGTEVVISNVFKSSKITEVTFPYTITELRDQAFNTASKLTKITFEATPDYATPRPLSVPSGSIVSCSYLTEIKFPARLAEFESDSIQKCSKFASITIEDGKDNKFLTIGDEGRKVVCTGDGKTLVYCPKGMEGEFSVPVGIMTIAKSAFEDCTKLTAIHITETVSTISEKAFKGCYGLTLIDLGGKDGAALSIGKNAFENCNKVTELTISERVVKIEEFAFAKTSKLVKVIVNTTGIVPDGAPEGTPATVDFANNAFGTDAAIPLFYVKEVTIGTDVPVFDIPGVFGQKIESVTVDSQNNNYSSQDGVLFDKGVTRIIYYPTGRAGDYVIPDTVTAVGDRVFQAKTGLTGITIGPNVKSIGESAFFGCSAMKFVKFTAVTEGSEKPALTIGKSAFRNCSGLQSIELPDHLVSIGAEAFYNCSKLTEVTVPEGVTEIGAGAFQSCSSLEKISLPKSLEKFGNDDNTAFNVFLNCKVLATVEIDKDNIHYAAIDNIIYRKSEKTVNGKTEYIPTKLLYCVIAKAGTTDAVIPDSVTEVGAGAFNNNSVVTSVTFGKVPAGEDFTVGDQAFSQCKALKKISLPEGLTGIAENMFYYCTSIEEIVIPSTVAKIENQAFYYCTSLSKLTFAPTPDGQEPVKLEILDAKSYSYAPFYGCKELKEITFPERLTYIGSYAFGGSPATGNNHYAVYAYIEKVYLPSTLERIGFRAFNYADKLTTVKFAAGTVLKDLTDSKGNISASAIGEYAFDHCSALTLLELPAAKDSKYSIGKCAFQYAGLTELAVPASVSSLGDYCFARSKIAKLTFADGAAPVINKGAFNAVSIETLVLPEGITELGESAFASCAKLKSVTLPYSLENLGVSAFASCTSLSKVTMTNAADGTSKLAAIGNLAFQKTLIESFVFPTLANGKVLSLGTSLFSGCTALDSVYLSKSVGNVNGVFTGCNTIKNFVVDPESENFSSVEGSPILYNKNGTAYKYICGLLTGSHTIPVGVTEISENVFLNQIGLTELYIPYTVQKIGANAFQGCTALTKVVFEHSAEHPSQLSVADLGTKLFTGCKSLTDVTLPANLTVIPKYMFSECTSLTTITLPAGITEIGDNAFNKAGLTEITIPATVESIGSSAFSGASKGNGTLVKVTFAKDKDGNCALTSIGSNAFRFQNIVSIVIPKSVTTIGNYAFATNLDLTSFTFESGTKITTFGTYIFSTCEKLPTFTVPKSVTTLGNYSFESCTALKEVIFEEGSKLTATGTYTFKGSGIVSIVFPDSLKIVGTTKATAPSASSSGNLFYSCESLTSVTFGKNVTHINGKTFYNCTALTKVNIPDTVTQIGVSTFEGCTSLKSVEFGENSKLTTLGASVFKASGIESISLPANVTLLGTGSKTVSATTNSSIFSGCVSLKSVEFKGDVAKIGASAFEGCVALTEIKLPESVTLIGKNCFKGCTALAKIDLGNNPALTNIGAYAFANTAIESFTVPSGVTLMGNGSTSASATTDSGIFSGCANLKSVEFKGKVTKFGTKVFQGCVSLTTVNLPDSVTVIGRNCFDGCASLKAITLNEGITEIGDQAFYGCESIESINIPKSCTKIGENVFGACHKLATFTVAAGNTKFAVEQSALVQIGSPVTILAVPGTATGTLVIPAGTTLSEKLFNGQKGITEIVLMDGITSIPDYAFYGAKASKITLPSTLETIGKYAFKDSEITEIKIPASVKTIKDYAFSGCSKLAKIEFEENSELTTIYTHVFEETAISEITLPAKLTMLGSTVTASSYAFNGCVNLQKVTFLGEMISLNSYAFQNCKSLKSFTIPATVKHIGSSCFAGSGLTSIVIPKTLNSLGEGTDGKLTSGTYTFSGCESLKTVIFEEGIQVINNYAFRGCTALTTVVIPASVTEIGNNAFANCTALETVTFAEGTKIAKMGTSVFMSSGIKTFEFPKAITEIPSSTFASCENLTGVTFLGEITSIGSSAFAGCTSLESFTIPETVTTLGASAFKGSGIKSIYIPGSITSSSSYVFQKCEQLESVVFAEGVEKLGTSMFEDCINLKSVKLSSTINYISSWAFGGCTSLKSIVIPAAAVTAYSKIFEGWTADQTIYFEGDSTNYDAWGSSWNENCEAKLVYNYKAE